MTESHLGMLGKYQVIKEIGRGGFSIVYLAEHPRLKKATAIKLMLPALFNHTDSIQRFISEARTMAALKHENITPVLDLAEENSRLYMVMEYMPGGDLHKWLEEHGKPVFRRSVDIISAIAAALDYAHSQGIIHGDVKPGNILLNAEGMAKLTDFGVLRAVENSGVTSADMTRGTPYYISPEQAEGSRPTPRSDQYALGVVAYELLTGHVPFEGDTPLAIYLKHIREPLPPARQFNPNITPTMEAALTHALQKDPTQRYADCRTFANALRDAVAATEAEHFKSLMKKAAEALSMHQPETARPLLEDALQIQPDNKQARALLDDLQKRERAQKGYQAAGEAIFTARNAARILREQPVSPPDPDGLIKHLAPPPLPAWKKLLRRWRWGLSLALGLCILGGLFGIGNAIYTSLPQGAPHKASLVAQVRTSTSTATLTPTFTPTLTFTPTQTATATATFTSTITLTPTPTPTATALGGGSGKLIYQSSGDIFVVNTDGTNSVNLTKSNSNDDFRAWSPDGKKIVFESYRDGNTEIYSMNADGTNPVNLTKSNGTDYFSAWSPDGKKILFQSFRDGNYEIYSMNADGTNPVNLTKSNGTDYFSAWSSDGKKILFQSFRDGNYEIFSMNADGTDPINLTKSDGHDYFSAWSPDGKKIVFQSSRDSNDEIYSMNADSTDPINLTKSYSTDNFGSWSPDGKKILFRSYRDGNYEIFSMNADGTNPINLTKSNRDDYFRAWSPDGKKIVFQSSRDGNAEIYSMNADGTDPLRLTKNNRDDYFSAWSPDGRKIVFYSELNSVYYNVVIMNADGTDQKTIISYVTYSDIAWVP